MSGSESNSDNSPLGSKLPRRSDPFSQPKLTPRQKREREKDRQIRTKQLLDAAMSEEHARFYNQVGAKAHVEFWSRRLWDERQTVALSFGRDPDVVNRMTLEPYYPVWQFARDFDARRRLVRQLFAERGEAGLIAPIWYIRWAIKNGIAIPDDLRREIEEQHERELEARKRENAASAAENSSEADSSNLSEKLDAALSRIRELEEEIRRLKQEEEINPKTRKIYDILVFLLGLKYRFSLDGRTSAAANVVRELENHRIKISQEVVLDRFRFAAQRRAEGDFGELPPAET